MPSNAHCVAFGCTNRFNRCKHGLVPSKDGLAFVRVRLCGQADPGCGNTSAVCKNVSFHRLPKDNIRRDRWVRAMRRENLPITSNTRLCSVHFEAVDLPSTDRQTPKGDPMKFLKISKPPKER